MQLCKKLDEATVRDIRRRYLAGERKLAIASDLGISGTTVGKYTVGMKRKVAPPACEEGEEWRESGRFPGYHVSNMGRVWSDGSASKKVGLLKTRDDRHALNRVNIKADGCRVTVAAHILVATEFLREGREDEHVCFKDGDRGNMRASNLEWRERDFCGRAKSNRDFNAVRNGGVVEAMRIMHARGQSDTQIMETLGVTRYIVSKYAHARSLRYG